MNECFDCRVRARSAAQDSFDMAASPDACDIRSTGPRGGFACTDSTDTSDNEWAAHPHIAFEAMRLVLWHLQHNDRLIYLNLMVWSHAVLWIYKQAHERWTNMDWTASDARYRRDAERYICESLIHENKFKMLWLSWFVYFLYLRRYN